MAKNRRGLEGFPESLLRVLTNIIKDKGDVLSGEYREGSCDITIVLNKTTVKVIKTEVALYPLYITNMLQVLNYINLF